MSNARRRRGASATSVSSIRFSSQKLNHARVNAAIRDARACWPPSFEARPIAHDDARKRDFEGLAPQDEDECSMSPEYVLRAPPRHERHSGRWIEQARRLW